MTALTRVGEIQQSTVRSGMPGKHLAIVAALPAIVLLVAPILVIIPMSFTSSNVIVLPPETWGLDAYRDLFADPSWRHSFAVSLQAAGIAVVLAVTVGTSAAIGLGRYTGRLGRLGTALVIAPLSIPLVVLGLSMFQMFARYRMIGTVWGIGLGHSVVGVPYVFITVRAALSRLDERLVRSAVSLGAGALSVLRFVYFPALFPAVLSGAILTFAVSFDDVVISLFLSGPNAITLPVKLFTEIEYNLSPVIMAVSTILLGVVLVGALAGFVAIRMQASQGGAFGGGR